MTCEQCEYDLAFWMHVVFEWFAVVWLAPLIAYTASVHMHGQKMVYLWYAIALGTLIVDGFLLQRWMRRCYRGIFVGGTVVTSPQYLYAPVVVVVVMVACIASLSSSSSSPLVLSLFYSCALTVVSVFYFMTRVRERVSDVDVGERVYAPVDGTIVGIDHERGRVTIFLNVFDAHDVTMPLSGGSVVRVGRRGGGVGEWAWKRESEHKNESVEFDIEPMGRMTLVAGPVGRRIYVMTDLKREERRGELIAYIVLGSRAVLEIDTARWNLNKRLRVGERIRSQVDVLAERRM